MVCRVTILCLRIVVQVYMVTAQMQDGEKIPYRCFGQAGSFGWSGDCACSTMLPWAMDNSIPQTNQQLVDEMQNIKARLDQLEAVTAQITSSGSQQKTGPGTDSRPDSRADSRVVSAATARTAVQTTPGADTSSTVGSDVAISDSPQTSAIYTAAPTQVQGMITLLPLVGFIRNAEVAWRWTTRSPPLAVSRPRFSPPGGFCARGARSVAA
ncbi:uncharacterized protein LOC144887435 [Branchiostoma floridae x Branchiostoma japonicum]